MFVATNRQRPPQDNAFARRAQMKRGGPIASEAAPETEPLTVVENPDVAKMQELLAAAQVTEEPAPPAADPEPETEPEPKGRPGRAKSAATLGREAKVLEYVTDAKQVGVTKAVLSQLIGATPQQVNAALQALAAEGKVESKPKPDSKALLWFAR